MGLGFGQISDLVDAFDRFDKVFATDFANDPLFVVAKMPLGQLLELPTGVIQRAWIYTTLARKAFFRNKLICRYNLHWSVANFGSKSTWENLEFDRRR